MWNRTCLLIIHKRPHNLCTPNEVFAWYTEYIEQFCWTYLLFQLTITLNLIVLAISEMEMNVISAERVTEYTHLPTEVIYRSTMQNITQIYKKDVCPSWVPFINLRNELIQLCPSRVLFINLRDKLIQWTCVRPVSCLYPSAGMSLVNITTLSYGSSTRLQRLCCSSFHFLFPYSKSCRNKLKALKKNCTFKLNRIIEKGQ